MLVGSVGWDFSLAILKNLAFADALGKGGKSGNFNHADNVLFGRYHGLLENTDLPVNGLGGDSEGLGIENVLGVAEDVVKIGELPPIPPADAEEPRLFLLHNVVDLGPQLSLHSFFGDADDLETVFRDVHYGNVAAAHHREIILGVTDPPKYVQLVVGHRPGRTAMASHNCLDGVICGD